MKPPLEELVAAFVARREEGEALSPRRFADEHPDAGPELLKALLELAATEGLFPRHEGQLPRQVGPYRVSGRLGSGGMGHVLRVEHEDRPGEMLALKLLHLSSQMNPRTVERFEREASILREIDHPGIVRVRDVGCSGGENYLVMDLVEGESLSAVLAAARSDRGGHARAGEGSPSSDLLALAGDGNGVRRAAEVVRRLAQGVSVLHVANCIHRDIKPSNVILVQRADPVLIDFGLAGLEDASSLTRTGDVIGTPHYMSPEQARGKRVDERTDVWALGAILYELLTLRPPHAGQDALAVLHAIRRRPIVPVRRLEADVPAALARIVACALAQRVESRYRNAGALADDLEAFLAGRRVRARRSLGDRSSDLWRFQRNRLMVAAALIAALLVWNLRGNDAKDASGEVERAEALRRSVDRATMSWAIDDREAMRTASQEILKLDPTNSTGEFLLSLAQGSVLIDAADPAVEALIRGVGAEQDDDTAGARNHYRRAAELDPTSPVPLIMMGMIGDEKGELEQRLVDLRHACEENPRSAAAAHSLGATLYQLERYPEAVEQLEKAVQLAPQFTRSHVDLSEAQFFAEGLESGLATARNAKLATGSESDIVLISYAAFLTKQKHLEVARELMLEILPRNPGDAKIYFEIALTYDFEERIVEALPWYEQALARDSEHTEVLKALLHMHSGANRDTCEKCASAFEKDPWVYDPEKVERYGARLMRLLRGENLGIMLWIARTAKRVERTAAIRETLEEILQLDLDPDAEANIHQALGALLP